MVLENSLTYRILIQKKKKIIFIVFLAHEILAIFLQKPI